MSDPAPIGAIDAAPALNPALPIAALAEEFHRKGRIHIPNVLTADSARRLHLALKNETPWKLTLNKGTDFLDFPNLSAEERQRISMGAWERAQTGFQYLFENHRISRDGEPYPDPGHYFAKLIAFFNTPHFLNTIRKITGIEDIVRTDAQATLYRPGDFLTLHDDKYGGRHRLAAYVLNLTPAWRPDWGGVLNFYDARGHIEEGFVPTFNALNLFRVPVWHSVSQVAIFGGLRYSVTGWFHAAQKFDTPPR